MSETKFKVRNNDIRSYGFAGHCPGLEDKPGICVAGCGCPTPPKAAQQVIDGQPFRLPPMFQMSEDEMFRSYRGILATMKIMTRDSKPAIEVFLDGIPNPLTAEEIGLWVDEYRKNHKLAEPKTRDEHTREIERAMNRPEDPIDHARRVEKEEERQTLVQTVVAAVLAVLKPEKTDTEGRARQRT